MVLNIVTEQIKETRFLSQVSRSYLSNLDGEPPSKVQKFFGKSLLSQLLHYLESHVWGQKAAILFFWLLRLSYRYFKVAPLPELIVRPQRPLIPKMVLLSAL